MTQGRKGRGQQHQPWPPTRLSFQATSKTPTRGDDSIEFIESYCRVVKDSVGGRVGDLMVMRPWQQELLRSLLVERPDGRLRHRQALIGMPRKNGKSALLTGLALWALLTGPEGGEVYSLSGDRDQARITHETAKRMVELDRELSQKLKVYRDAIEVIDTSSVWRVMSSDAPLKEGLSPTLALVDEVHVIPRDLWDVMSLAGGARREPLMIGITTAGVRYDSSGRDSLCFQLYEHGKRVVLGEIEDPSFFFAWWEPKDPESDHRDPQVWREANPGFGDVVSEEDFHATVQRTPESEFRIKRTNQWVTASEAWLPTGAWEQNVENSPILPGERVVLGFDGSFNNDCTALVACKVQERPHLEVVELWEAPELDLGGVQDWRVPIEDVEETIRQACKRFQVLEISCDPYRWARSYQILEAEGLPVVEFPQSPARMTPATQHFYEAVINRQLSHSGDPRLARHVGNAVLKSDSRGMRIYKEHRNSSRRIDLAVAALMAFERAYWHGHDAGGWVGLDFV